MEIFAALADKGYTREQIGRLDPWWIRNVIFYPREKDGNLTPRQDSAYRKTESMTEKEAFYHRAKMKGYADWKIDELWEKLCGRENGQRPDKPQG